MGFEFCLEYYKLGLIVAFHQAVVDANTWNDEHTFTASDVQEWMGGAVSESELQKNSIDLIVLQTWSLLKSVPIPNSQLFLSGFERDEVFRHVTVNFTFEEGRGSFNIECDQKHSDACTHLTDDKCHRVSVIGA